MQHRLAIVSVVISLALQPARLQMERPALAITVQMLSGHELRIMAEPWEFVYTVRQRVEEQIGIGEFQEVKFYMGSDEMCYDVSVGESGILDSTVQAVLITNVCKAKQVIKEMFLFKASPLPPNRAPPSLQSFSLVNDTPKDMTLWKAPPLPPNRTPPSLQSLSLVNEIPLRVWPHPSDMEWQCILALDVLEEIDFDAEDTRKLLQDFSSRAPHLFPPLLLARVGSMSDCPKRALQSLSDYLMFGGAKAYSNAVQDSAVWIKLIDSSAPFDEDHAQGILCALASFHPAAAVRAAAMRAFGSAPVWAVSHIRDLMGIAYGVHADPDESVREAAAASAQLLKDAQAHGRLPPVQPAVRPAAPIPQGPPPQTSSPPARQSAKGEIGTDQAKLKQQEDLQKSEEEDLQMEQQALQEALLRSKADAWSADGIILSRLTFHSPSVTSFLLESNDLAICRSRVESAGCSMQPAWANGALLLVPVTEQQIMEADIYLQAHNILMLASDEQLVKEALAELSRRKRPGLKPEHYPHGKLPCASEEAKGSTGEAEQQPSEEFQLARMLVTDPHGKLQCASEEAKGSTSEAEQQPSEELQLAKILVTDPNDKLQCASEEAKGSTSEVEQQRSEVQLAKSMVTESPGDAKLQSEAHLMVGWMQDVGIVVERTFLSFPTEKDISEASTIIHSAPEMGEASSSHTNPHQWRLPRPQGERQGHF